MSVNLQLELDILDEPQDENDDGLTTGASSDVAESISVSETTPTRGTYQKSESQLAGDNVTSL